jgi:acetylglutamate kinase
MPRLRVVKVGGNEIDDHAWTARLATAIATDAEPVVLVHGGGKEVTDLQRMLGAEPEWRDGLRVTTPEAIRAVSMVLSGVVNKRLVAALLGAGVDALGISGEDAALLCAMPARGGTLGRTGEITTVRAGLLITLLNAGMTPVVSPVSRGEDGGALNVNADDAAAAIATALGAAELMLVSNVPGVREGASVLTEVDVREVEELIASGTVSGGMAPKLRAAARVASAGVEVRIGGVEMLADPFAGTRVRSTRLGAVPL